MLHVYEENIFFNATWIQTDHYVVFLLLIDFLSVN